MHALQALVVAQEQVNVMLAPQPAPIAENKVKVEIPKPFQGAKKENYEEWENKMIFHIDGQGVTDDRKKCLIFISNLADVTQKAYDPWVQALKDNTALPGTSQDLLTNLHQKYGLKDITSLAKKELDRLLSHKIKDW